MPEHRFSIFQLQPLIRILMVQLVLLPVYGSWLNKDYAGLQPFHDHIFLKGIVLNHHHPGSQGDNSAGSDGVVNIPDQDAAGSGLLFLPFLGAAVVVTPDSENGLQFSLYTPYTFLRGIFPSPLERPPRI